MAARENQGYLIAVIILVLLSLVLALVSFLGVQKAYELSDVAEASDAKLKVSRLIADAEDLKGDALKAIIGDLGIASSEVTDIRNKIQQISTDSALTDADKKIVSDILAEVTSAQEIYKSETNGEVASSGDGDASEATLRGRLNDLTLLVDRMRSEYRTQVRQTDEDARDAKGKIADAEEARESAVKELDLRKRKVVKRIIWLRWSYKIS